MKRNKITVGRALQNDVVLSGRSVSKFHCTLEIHENGSLWVEDQNSLNGVFVNDRRISSPTRLRIGDRIRLGSEEFDWEGVILTPPSARAVPPRSEPVSPVFAPQRRTNVGVIVSISGVLLLIGVLWATGSLERIFESTGSEVEEEWKLKNDPIVYDARCLTDSNAVRGVMNEIKREKDKYVSSEGGEVTLEEEVEVGQEAKRKVEQDYAYCTDPTYTERVEGIFQKLVSELDSSRFDYACYVLESEEINAFTSGGNVFIFTGMIDFAESDDELACVLGHELYHNELGHITQHLKEMKLARAKLGEGLGDLVYLGARSLTVSFNQENEVYSDLYGMDLAVRAGFDGCAGIDFWERMHEENSSKKRSIFASLISSHPFSDERARCNREHLDRNYYHTCE
jgi:hypothetical protein